MGSTRRRSYGEGSVEKRTDRPGTYRGRVMIDGRRYSVTASTQRERDRQLDDLRRQVLAGKYQTETPRLGDWLGRWYDAASVGKAPKTIKGYRWAITHLRPLQHVRLAALTAEQVDDLLATLGRGRGRKQVGALSRDSLRKIRRVLGQALDYAERRQLVTWNAARHSALPKVAKATRPRRSLTLDEAQLLLEAAALDGGDRFQAGLLLMLVLGMRPGEATGLHWSALDLDAGTLDVVKMRRPQPGGGFVFVDPKAASFRSVRLPAAVVEALRTRQAQQAATRLAATRWEDLDLVLSTRYGTALGERQIWKTVARLCTAAGVERISPNELRHTATTLLRNAGVSLEQIRLLVGHADFRMLHQHYLDDLAVVDLTAPMGEVFG